MLASTLAALTASNSGAISPTSALASVFGHNILGGLNLSNSSFLNKEQRPRMVPISTNNSISSNELLSMNAAMEKPEQKPKGCKIEDIIKRIRDKKNS